MSAAIAVAALSFAYGAGWPDVSRLALTQSLAYDGTLHIDRFARQTEDRADFVGHTYSDKAPGISLLSAAVARSRPCDGRGRRVRPRAGRLARPPAAVGSPRADGRPRLRGGRRARRRRGRANRTRDDLARRGHRRPCDDGAADGGHRLRPPRRREPRLRRIPACLARRTPGVAC